jgi:hypothetical protein
MMTQGIIVYLLGGGEPPAGVIPATHYRGLSQSGAPLEVVVSRPGILELDDAWHFMLARGCEPIHLLVTQTEHDRLQPLYPLVRLTGITRVTAGLSGAYRPGRVLH